MYNIGGCRAMNGGASFTRKVSVCVNGFYGNKWWCWYLAFAFVGKYQITTQTQTSSVNRASVTMHEFIPKRIHQRQECIPVGCVPPAAVDVPGKVGSPPDTPLGNRPPPEQTPPGADPPPWTEFLTYACENITLPQTSFAGGKYTGQRSVASLAFKWCALKEHG